MKRTGSFLIVFFALANLGCARGDWISETLTLVDVTGTWEGTVVFRNLVSTAPGERATRWVLQQKGEKVRGVAQQLDGEPLGTVEGLFNGEVFNWQLTGAPYSPRAGQNPSTYRGAATVNGDERSGRGDGHLCVPCTFVLRRVR